MMLKKLDSMKSCQKSMREQKCIEILKHEKYVKIKIIQVVKNKNKKISEKLCKIEECSYTPSLETLIFLNPKSNFYILENDFTHTLYLLKFFRPTALYLLM